MLIKGSVMSFCYNISEAFKGLKKGDKKEFNVFGTESDEYFLKLQLSGPYISIFTGEKKLRYDIDSFSIALCDFIEKLVYELPLYYDGIELCKYFTKFKRDLR